MLLLLLLLATDPSILMAQDALYVNHLTSNEGLSSNRINCIYEDSEGFMWFGSEDGLNLYDGVNITIFKYDPQDSSSICNSSVYSITGDPLSGDLWIGTRKGLCRFNKASFSFSTMFLNSSLNDISDHIIYDLKFDKDHTLWIATSYGLYTFNEKDSVLHRYLREPGNPRTLASNAVEQVFFDNDGQVYLCTRGGVNRYNPVSSTFTLLFPGDSLRLVKQIFLDSRGDHWICTDNMGVYRASLGDQPQLTPGFFRHPALETGERIHSITEDENHNLILVARDKGLFIYNRTTGRLAFHEPDVFDPNSLNSKALICSYKSSSGIIWLGTFSSGINFIDYNRKPFLHYKVNYKESGVFNNNIRALFQDREGNIWVGTKEGGGLSRFDPATGTFINYKVNPSDPLAISSDYVLSISELDRNTLILGTLGEGLDLFDKRHGTFRNIHVHSRERTDPSDNRIYSIFRDREECIWVASLNNLFQYEPRTNTFTGIDDIKTVKCFAQQEGSGLWIGTKFNGLLCYADKTWTYRSAGPDGSSLSGEEITALKFLNDSTLCVGTTFGLNLLDLKTGSFSSWFEKDGLAGNRVCGIEIDLQGNIWCSTTNGLSKFNPVTADFKNYYQADGLQGNEFEMYVSAKTSDGLLLFGGSNGFNIFNPEEIKDNLHVPKIQFTDFKLANRSVAINGENSPLKKHINRTDKITLKYSQADFTLEYVALNYTSPEKNQYKYMLEGYDDDWVAAGTKRFASYTNLGPGAYTFRVEASNNDNIWNHEGRSLEITILPPPWKTFWAYLVYVILIAFIVISLYYFIVKRIEQQSLLKMERAEREKTEQLNQLKLRFFTNISHEFRTPLTLISSPLSRLIDDPGLKQVEQRYLYLTMQKNVKRLLRLIRQLMDFRKIENQQMLIRVREGSLASFINELIDGFREYAEHKKVNIRFETEAGEDTVQWFDQNIIDGVIFNLLSNAVKFSPEKADIIVGLELADGRASIQVTDHGVGIPPEKINRIFERFYSDGHGMDEYAGSGIGLSFSQSLINLHRGEITVSSIPGEQTVFSVSIPVTKEAYSAEEFAVSSETFLKPDVLPVTSHGQEEETGEELFSPESRKNTMILIVEDNDELRNFLANHFSTYRVLEAADGEDALKKAGKHIPDLVISDVMMPKMNGIRLCQELKSNFITSHIPLILLTAKTATEYKIEGYECGADAYIEKPFDIGLLEAQVHNLIQQRQLLRKRFSGQLDPGKNDNPVSDYDREFFEKALELVSKNISDTGFAVGDLSSLLHMSRSQLFRKFKMAADISPSDFIRNERIRLARTLLEEGRLNINEISIRTGFSSPSHFISSFKKLMGCTPKEYLHS